LARITLPMGEEKSVCSVMDTTPPTGFLQLVDHQYVVPAGQRFVYRPAKDRPFEM